MKENAPIGFITMEANNLVKCPWNYRDNDDAMLEKLVANIKKNGFLENLIVRELKTGAFELVNGNHRFDAIQKLGVENVMVYNLGVISEAKAKRIAIETNETSFPNDQLKIAQMLREITAEFSIEDVLETIPFSENQLNKYLKLDNWSVAKEGNKSQLTEDQILVKFIFNEEQHEQWQDWKVMSGTDNDIEALLKALEICKLAFKDHDS